MKLVSVETPEKSVCKMTFSATAEELETASNAVYERTRASYTIKGFAKGEADRAQIEADRGEHTFWYDAINDLMDRDVPALYEAAMAEHGFKAVDEPSYDLVSVKKDEGFVATATTPLQPELNLTQTTGFHVECVTPAVTDKEIDAVLERRRNAAAELVPHKGPAVKGNIVHIDYEGLLDGKPFQGGSAQNQPLQLGSGRMIPGFEDGIDGFTLGEKMQQSAERFGAVTELAEVYKASLSGKIKTLETSEGVFQGRTVVIATGASPRPLGIPGEDTLTGKGVHYCAACDGAPYRGKTVAVVGGGNSAAADALTLSRIAKKVYLIHRRDSLRATKVYHEPLMAAPNVEFCWNSTVSALLHESRLTGLRLQDVNTGAERDLACDGVFISVGRAPATELFRDDLALDKSGYIIADESTRTSIPGVFAAGDVRTKALRQVVTAVSDGAVAVHYAEEYLAENR